MSAASTSKRGTQVESAPVAELRHAGVFGELRRLLSLPVTSYYLVMATTLALTAFGLVMVLSASSITSYNAGAGSSFAVFNRQAIFAVLGTGLMFLIARMPPSSLRKLALPLFIFSLLLQALPLVPGVGKNTGGNLGWISLPGGFQLQPAEFLKLTLALWLGATVARHAPDLAKLPVLAKYFAPGLVIAIGLVLAGRDLGTGLIVIGVAAGGMFVAGIPWRYFIGTAIPVVAIIAVSVVFSKNRMNRIMAVLAGHSDTAQMDPLGQHWQSNHGLFALASGGWFGVGLGAGREKWSWLPEAHNDFIFAIIGEELGLLGSLIVIGLFVCLGYGLIRIVLRSSDIMAQVATAAVFTWLIGQAMINIGVVTTLLPVIGVPLPFVSYGGSALIASMSAIGVVLSFARAETGAKQAMTLSGRRIRSSLAVLANKARPGRKS